MSAYTCANTECLLRISLLRDNVLPKYITIALREMMIIEDLYLAIAKTKKRR